MKYNLLSIFFLVFILGMYSCQDDQQTYAEELKAEQDLIQSFLVRQNIRVVTAMPDTFPWPENTYFKSSTGLYIRLISEGNGTDTVAAGDKVVTRYIQYTLDETPDSIFNMTTIDNPMPTTFSYLDYTQVCTAWHEAVGYMKYHNAFAKLIVYSKIGFSTYNRPATPIGYDLKIMIQKN